jgi:ABC-2 type transport system permease protein
VTSIRAHAVALVARREIAQQVRGKALWISTALTIIGIALVIVLPNVISSGPDQYRVAVTSASGGTTDLLERTAAAVGVQVTVVPAPAADPQASLRGKDKADLLLVTQPLGLYLDHAPDSSSSLATFVAALSRDLGLARSLAAAHLTPAQQQAVLNPRPVPVHHLHAPPSTAAGHAVALAGSVLFFFLAMRYGIGLLVGIAQEKGSRVVEVVLSAVRPVELLAGKIIASVAIVTTQAILLAATALIAGAAIGSDILHGGGTGQIVVEAIWIVLGFLIYATLFAAAGSLASKPEDAQSVGLPIQLLLFVGYFASFSATGGTVSPILRVLAWVPFTAPMNMPMLWALGGANAAQVGISMAIAAGTVVLVTRLAAAVFSASILRTGQRVRLKPLLRDLRTGRT